MENEESVQNVNEVNIKLAEKIDANSKSLRKNEGSSVTETNLKIQEAFYNENNQDEAPPTYVTNETAAIKVTGG